MYFAAISLPFSQTCEYPGYVTYHYLKPRYSHNSYTRSYQIIGCVGLTVEISPEKGRVCFTAAHYSASQVATQPRTAALHLVNVIRHAAFGGGAGIVSFHPPHTCLFFPTHGASYCSNWWAVQIQGK